MKPDGDVAIGMPREWRRMACAELGHIWTLMGAPAGTQRCRRCALWESTYEPQKGEGVRGAY